MKSRLTTVAVLVVACLSGRTAAIADEPRPIAHWPLAEDARDIGPHELATTNSGVTFDKADEGAAVGSARFDGRGAHLAVKTSALPKIAAPSFTVALSIHVDDRSTGGELVSHYDPNCRNGWQLALRTNTGVTTCQPNTQQLQFGIDAGTRPQWRDEGRPGNAILAFALAVHAGHLYAGTCDPAKHDAGHVYRYDGHDKWVDLGTPDRCNAISAMAEYQGRLYVGSAKYRLAGSALAESQNRHSGGKIFRLETKDRWTEVGRLKQDQTAIGGMVVYRGQLYATSLYKPAGFYRYERDGQWTSLPTPEGLRVESLGVFHDYLWATSYDGGYVFRFDGTDWKSYGVVGDNTQTYSFAVLGGKLCVGTWPSGRVYRLGDDNRWEDLGRLGEEKEVMGMIVHNGQLYAGTLPLAEVYRYDRDQNWTNVGRLDLTPDVTYRRAWTMAQFQGRLFVSTLPTGRIHSMQSGPCITYDRELVAGWRHIAAVKDHDRLRLYVDGRQVVVSTSFDPAEYELSPEVELLIGASDRFRGKMRDVRIYAQALSAAEIQTISRP